MHNQPDAEAARQQPEDTTTRTRILPETAWAADPALTGIPPQNTIVVTVSRQFASQGSDVARLVAQACGLRYVDQQVITEVANQLHIEIPTTTLEYKEPPSTGVVGHIIEALQASNPLRPHYMLAPESKQLQSKEQAYLQLTQRVILEMATLGNIIFVGRGSQFILRNAPRTLHVSVVSTLPARLENVMQRFQLNRTDARQLIERRDYEQGSYLHKYYGSDGSEAALYHLQVNTGLLSREKAAYLIQQAIPLAREIA